MQGGSKCRYCVRNIETLSKHPEIKFGKPKPKRNELWPEMSKTIRRDSISI